MTLEQLKEKVHELIRKGQTEAALEAVGVWADAHQQAQVKTEVTLLMALWVPLSREKRLGLIDNAEVARRTNQINDGVLALLNNIQDEAGSDEPESAPTKDQPIDWTFELLKYLMPLGKIGTTAEFARQNGNIEVKRVSAIAEYLEELKLIKILGRLERSNLHIEALYMGEVEFERLSKYGKKR